MIYLIILLILAGFYILKQKQDLDKLEGLNLKVLLESEQQAINIGRNRGITDSIAVMAKERDALPKEEKYIITKVITSVRELQTPM